MDNNPYGQSSAPNPFLRDTLIAAAWIAGVIAVVILWRSFHLYENSILKMIGIFIAVSIGRAILMLIAALKNYFGYRDYVRDFRDGRPMSRENYLREQAMVNRELQQNRNRK